ncbi:MAG: transcription elongation factor GreA [Oscillospiraceae bacterium]|nr:transcription elongation factor GreA [Oscillospiraceae bacterium]
MAETKEYILTVEGRAKLEAELNQLVTVTRKQVSEKIKEARSFGDLSENAEYDAAKNEQAEVESRIQTIEHMLKYAKVVDVESNDIVTVGKVVTLRFHGELAELMDMAGEQTYTIVGTSEADPNENKLSYESPIGAACINKSVGDEVEAETPAGIVQFTIMNIEKTQ